MRLFEVLVLALLLVASGMSPGIVRPAQGQAGAPGRGDALLNLMEQQVAAIAAQASANMQITADLVGSCVVGGDCSRAECVFTDLDSGSYSCGKFPTQLDFCSDQPATCANTIRSTRTRGYVRTPVSSHDPEDLICDLRKSICVQRNLDAIFRNASNVLAAQYKDTIFFHMFFGSVAGDFRYFPGRDSVDCTLPPYDPRIRPWYIEAISVAKNLVVLIDNGQSMDQPVSSISTVTAFAVAKALTKALLSGAVANGDTISVIGYRSEIVYNKTVTVRASGTTNVSSQVEPLLSQVEGAPVPMDVPSNLTLGLQLAQQTVTGVDTPNCKIIVLFTHSASNPLQFSSELESVASAGTKLFIYTLGGTPFRNTTCYHFERLVPVDPDRDNLLLKLNAFFSFLTRSRMEANGGSLKPHWRSVYESSSSAGLGDVVTVGMPALSQDGSGQLIGVAGIDLPKNDLTSDVDLELDVNNALTTRNTQVPSNTSGEDLCMAAKQYQFHATSESCDTVPKDVVCPANSTLSNLQLLCCENCAGPCGSECAPQPSPPSSGPPASSPPTPPTSTSASQNSTSGGGSAPVKVIVPVAVVASVLGAALAGWWVKRRYFTAPFPKPTPPPSDLSPTPPGQSPDGQPAYRF